VMHWRLYSQVSGKLEDVQFGEPVSTPFYQNKKKKTGKTNKQQTNKLLKQSGFRVASTVPFSEGLRARRRLIGPVDITWNSNEKGI
jgi:hypothetical protein